MGLDIDFFRQRKADYAMLPVNGDWTPLVTGCRVHQRGWRTAVTVNRRREYTTTKRVITTIRRCWLTPVIFAGLLR